MAFNRYLMGFAGANGNALSAANTGFSNIVNTGGSGVLSNAESNPVGSLAAVMTASVTSGGHYGYVSGMSTNNLSFEVLFKIKTEHSAQAAIVWGGTGSQEWEIDYNPSTNKLEFKDDGNTTRWTSTSTLAADNATYYWLRGYVVNSATVGQFHVTLANASAPSTLLEDYTSAASFDTGGTAYTDLRIGPKCSTGTQTAVLVVGAWGYDPAATDLPPIFSSDGPPGSNAGSDITVDAGEAFTLTGVPTDDIGVASVAWKLSGGTVGTGNTLNRTAPTTLSGTTETYSFEVTDTNSQMTSDSVVVTVRAATTRLHNGTSVVGAINKLFA